MLDPFCRNLLDNLLQDYRPLRIFGVQVNVCGEGDFYFAIYPSGFNERQVKKLNLDSFYFLVSIELAQINLT